MNHIGAPDLDGPGSLTASLTLKLRRGPPALEDLCLHKSPQERNGIYRGSLADRTPAVALKLGDRAMDSKATSRIPFGQVGPTLLNMGSCELEKSTSTTGGVQSDCQRRPVRLANALGSTFAVLFCAVQAVDEADAEPLKTLVRLTGEAAEIGGLGWRGIPDTTLSLDQLSDVGTYGKTGSPALMHVWNGAADERAEGVGTNKVRACRNDECLYASVESAFAAAQDGDTIRILPGKYRDGGVLRANGVRVLAEGAHLHSVAMDEKASLVIKGNDTSIDGLRCSDIRVASLNGACIRLEGQNLTLRRVHFHDSQSGILCGNQGHGRIAIEDSTFESIGVGPGERANPHAIYIGTTDEFVLRRSRILRSQGEGHEVKSRARRTVLEENVIASLDGSDSRLIDVPNGGEVVIRRNVLEEGPNSVNQDVIGIGLERGKGHGTDHTTNLVLIEENTIILDSPGRSLLLNSRDVSSPVFKGNIVVGGPRPEGQGTRWYRNRASAGLPPYPALPPAGAPISETRSPKR